MKKVVALLLAMILAFTFVFAALAAENCTNNPTTTENGRTFESVRVALASDGKLACIKTLKESYSSLKGYDKEEIENISSVLKSGGILRAKGLIKGSLDENNMLADGSTVVELALEVVNLELLTEAVGDDLTAVTVMDAASIYHDGHIGHRAVDCGKTLVAKFHQKNGSILFVYYEEFDGLMRLAFDAEAAQVTGTSSTTAATQAPAATSSAAPTAEPTAAPTAATTAAPTTAPTTAPTAEPTAAPTAEPTAAPSQAPQATPAPENDDVILTF